MQKYRVIVTWEAVHDIAEIADYIEAQFLFTSIHFRHLLFFTLSEN